MTDLRPRPAGTTPVACPSCGHPINRHYVRNVGGCQHVEPGTLAQDCACYWTANDIAWWYLYGQLTGSVATMEPDDV